MYVKRKHHFFTAFKVVIYEALQKMKYSYFAWHKEELIFQKSKIETLQSWYSTILTTKMNGFSFPLHTIWWRMNQTANMANLTLVSHWTLKMTTAKVVEMSVDNNINSPNCLHLQTSNIQSFILHIVLIHKKILEKRFY